MFNLYSSLSYEAGTKTSSESLAILLVVATFFLSVSILLIQRESTRSSLAELKQRDCLLEEDLFNRITSATFEEMNGIDWELRCFDPFLENPDLYQHFINKNIALIQGVSI